VNEILFAQWVAENHYHLYNVEDELYYWKNESGTKTTTELYLEWIKQR
jgi:hypothetical protein